MSGWRIRPAYVDDADGFPAIEDDAADLLRQAPSLVGVTIPPARSANQYRAILRQGHSFAALADGETIGFAAARAIDDELHLHELSVRVAMQRKGVGAALLTSLIGHARERRFRAITLNTFRDIAWNAPFYQHYGFEIVGNLSDHPRLAAALEAAVEAGLPRERRCAMRLAFD